MRPRKHTGRVEIAPKVIGYRVDSDELAGKLTAFGLPWKFEALSLGSEKGTLALIPLDESSRADAERLRDLWNDRLEQIVPGRHDAAGTPATLQEAIYNGLEDEHVVDEQNARMRPEVIERHVRDFLAQRFCAAMIGTRLLATERELGELFTAITGVKLKK